MRMAEKVKNSLFSSKYMDVLYSVVILPALSLHSDSVGKRCMEEHAAGNRQSRADVAPG